MFVQSVGLAQEDVAQKALARSLNDAFADVYEKVSPSVVVIEAKMLPNQADGARDAWEFFFQGPGFQTPGQLPGASVPPKEGSGLIIRTDGYIVTNQHVLRGAVADGITVTLKDGRKLPAKLAGADERTDVAVLKVDAKDLAAAELGDSDKVRVGQFAFALGAPFDLPYTFTFGLVSATGRNDLLHLPDAYEDYIQTDAAINPGNSGGPLADIDGRVIGMNTLINGLNRGLGFAIPVNLVKDVSDQLIAKGRVA
ncbi:MAG TPA: trypsin-like peptidase domain-containing protein, partial [Chthoniobacterales bacterium]